MLKTERELDLLTAANEFHDMLESQTPFTRTVFNEAPSMLHGYAVTGILPGLKGGIIAPGNIVDFLRSIDHFHSVPGFTQTIYVGGWKQDWIMYLDAVIIVEDLDTAMKLGKAWNQLAIGEFRNNVYIKDIAL